MHDFVLANVRDVILERGLAVERHRLEKLIEAIPKNSDTKVLSALKHDAERLHSGSTVLVAWLDDDKIHRPLKLSPGQPASSPIEAIRRRVPKLGSASRMRFRQVAYRSAAARATATRTAVAVTRAA